MTDHAKRQNFSVAKYASESLPMLIEKSLDNAKIFGAVAKTIYAPFCAKMTYLYTKNGRKRGPG